jgi:hypothetical protein
MTDAEFEAQKARIERLFDRWIPLLGLSDWHIDRDYRRQDADDLFDRASGEIEDARCAVAWQYMGAVITIWLQHWTEYDDGPAEVRIVHELMHIMVNEMRPPKGKGCTAQEEHVCTTLAKAFIRTYHAEPAEDHQDARQEGQGAE